MSEIVSIIIPCFNSEKFVACTIHSALSQIYPYIEVIVIDDGSTDGSLDIIKSFGDRIRYHTQVNQGAPTARNRGLELAKGQYIKFLDADDILLPDCIALQVQQAQDIAGDRKAIVYGEATWVDQHRQPIAGYSLRPRANDEDIVTHILTACPLTSCPLHRKDYLMEIQGFDPTLPRGQEHDLHLRLALAGVEFIYYPDAVYEYRNYESDGRISNHSLSQKGALVQYNVLQKQQALIESKLGQPLPIAIRQAIAQRYWQFGRGILREGHLTASKQYFETAKALDKQHCVVGPVPYPQLVQWLGPHYAETVITGLKQLRSTFVG
ncbi:MAG: glycosyltransferase [Cyanobacteria bacterium P01_F01_bin.150]